MTGSNLAKIKRDLEMRRQDAQAAWTNFKEEVLSAYAIDAAIEDFSGIRLSGNYGTTQRMGCCPFHGEKNPSMSVRPKDGYFRCHSAGCDAKGNVFSFISQYLNVSYRDAVLMAADRAGIKPPEAIAFSPTASSDREIKPRKSFDVQMNPASLFDCDLIPAGAHTRTINPGEFVKVWHPGGGRTDKPCVKTYKPEMVHTYRAMSGETLCLVLRCIHRSGDKYFMPLRLAQLPKEAPDFLLEERETRIGWMVKGTTSGHRKPIYGMEAASRWLAGTPRRILVVEGEKTCDATRRMVSGTDFGAETCVLAPMGGHSASLYADWTEFMQKIDQGILNGLTFSVWPDADHEKTKTDGTVIDPQDLYVRDTIGAFIVAARKAGLDPSKVTFLRAVPGTSRASGWDLADAEKEGWTAEDVQRELMEKGVLMPVEKRFMELDVTCDGEDDMIPFDDSQDDVDAFIASQLHDDQHDEALMEETKNEISEAVTIDPELAQFDRDLDVMTSGLVEMTPPTIYERTITEAEISNEDDPVIDEASEDDMADVLEGRIDARPVIGDNPFFRCLGYRECNNYFMSLKSGQIFVIAAAALRKNIILSLAPLQFWEMYYVEHDNQGRGTTNWDRAISDLVTECYQKGYWDPKKEAGQGARIDSGRVVFNTGDRLWIQNEPDGPGVVSKASDFYGEYHYTVGDTYAMPDFDRAFTPKDDEPKELLELLRKINWREDTKNLSVLALFGWLAIGPICGVLPWRPHLWMDGERGSGKSWIIDKIIKPTLGSYALQVKSNSTESGLRHMLHSRAFPLVFDEAEGEMDGDKARMASILKLARHSATPGDSVVAQGSPGGNGLRYFSIASTFLLASITPQIEASADKTRFARAKLGPGHHLSYFTKHLEGPAMELITPDFSSRLIARMIMRAGSIKRVQAMMVHAFATSGIERRLSDVWGTFAAGAWLLLKDGVPASHVEALEWIESTFHIGDEIDEFAAEISEDKDHTRLFRHLIAHEVRCETLHLGVRNFNLGSIISMALHENEDDDDVLDMKQARKQLANIGIRLGSNGIVAKDGDEIDSLIIHKKSPKIEEILARTPYQTSYVDVIQQAEDVKNGPSVRFGGLGTSRSVIVPLKHFPITGHED